jgi:hypothetical protein
VTLPWSTPISQIGSPDGSRSKVAASRLSALLEPARGESPPRGSGERMSSATASRRAWSTAHLIARDFDRLVDGQSGR